MTPPMLMRTSFLSAKAYQSYVIQRRASKNITATLKESRPMLEITPQDLDANPYLLCTPDATYDLRLGMAGAREHGIRWCLSFKAFLPGGLGCGRVSAISSPEFGRE